VRYRFIEDHRQEYPVSLLCETLGVSISGYYAWRKRPMSQHQREDGQLAEQIQAAYHANRELYGSPRVHAELQAQGITCSRKRVARLMRELELTARRSRHRTKTTRSDPSAQFAPNRLDRDFTATRPDEKWAGDITAIWTYEGWLYLSAVLDLFSRRVVGWAMAASADETLVEMALRMALLQRRPQAGLLHHTDRGCQYTSHAYQALLADGGIMVSMSRKGNCWDNAAMESFFGTLKSECVDLTFFQTRTSARQAVFEFVECFYNRVRRHSSLEYVSPVAFEQLHC
jgi:putative transposase